MHNHKHIVRYLAEETNALINATDNVSYHCDINFIVA